MSIITPSIKRATVVEPVCVRGDSYRPGHQELRDFLEEMQESIDVDNLRKEVKRTGRVRAIEFERL